MQVMGTKAAWTSERRAKQAAIIRQTQPWKQSTGPKTPAGKAASSRNAFAGEWYHETIAQLADAKKCALAVLGYSRLPTLRKADTRRT